MQASGMQGIRPLPSGRGAWATTSMQVVVPKVLEFRRTMNVQMPLDPERFHAIINLNKEKAALDPRLPRVQQACLVPREHECLVLLHRQAYGEEQGGMHA